MEIHFKKTYAPARGKRYALGEIQFMLGYAMEIANPRTKMQEGKLNPGEICMMIFGLTPEEYALKDQNPKALDALADQMLKHVPADRLLGWRIIDLKGTALNRDVKPQTGESIDKGAFQALLRARAAAAGPVDGLLMEAVRLQKLCARKNADASHEQDWQYARRELCAAILKLDRIWTAYDLPTGNRWPFVGNDGRVEIFTTEERAQRVKRQIQSVYGEAEIWSIREISGVELEKWIRTCTEEGFLALRVDNGFAAAECRAQDFCMDIPEQKNAALRNLLIREVQFGMRLNCCKAAKASEQLVRGALESMLTLRNFAWREIGNAKLYALCADGKRDHCVVIGAPDGKERLLSAFTSAERARAFAKKVKGDVCAVEMDFDGLAQRSAACDGLLVDVDRIAYRLRKADYDSVRDLRQKPPTAVRVQAAPAAKPEAKPQTDFGSLPDPDQFDAPKPPKADKVQAPAAEEAPEARGGGLNRWFKKRK